MIMGIACDIDGVLANFDRCFRLSMRDLLGIDRVRNSAQTWDLCEAYGITKEQHDLVWQSRNLQLYMAAAPVYNAGRLIAAALPAGSFYITARGCDLSKHGALEFRKLTIEWLVVNGFPDHTVVFSDDKVAFCKRHGITEAIDDAPHHVQAYSDAGITVHMPIAAYNTHKIGLPLVDALYGWEHDQNGV